MTLPVLKIAPSVPSGSVPDRREADAPDGGRETVLSLRGVTKTFGQLLANDEVDLDVQRGEVHALLGENGAGKSTLMKVAYGFYRADSGAMVVHGTPAQIRTPQDARRLGIGMVFQNFTLIPAFTVAENIALFLPRLPVVLRRDAVVKRIDEVAGRYGLTVDAQQLAGRLSVGEQQKVEILKLLLAGARILIFDEPTSVLPPHEVEALFQIFNRLRGDGFAVIFITHKLSEVFACADRITVMRAGAVSGTLSTADATEDDLIRLMFGTDRPGRPERKRALQEDLPALLELRQVATTNGHGTGRLRGLDLIVRAGEIVGVAGLPGNGQGPLGDVILGIERCERGQRLLFGKDATKWRVNRTRARGVAFIPDNPILSAVVPTMKLEENMALGATSQYSRRHGFGLDWARVRADLLGALQRLGLNIPPLTARAVTLSGGNLQRFTLARELSREPRLVIAIQPTRGLDLNTAAQAHQLLVWYREQGAGVVLISQDLTELFSLSDRLLVLRGGDIVGSVLPGEASAYDVGWLMAGPGGVT